MRMAVITALKTGVALVSNRVYGGLLDAKVALPAIRVTVIANRGLYGFGGAIGHHEPRMQIDCFAKTYDGAVQVAKGVRTTLDGWSTGALKYAGLVGERDMHDPDGNVFMVSVDYELLYRV